jgi:hypothetical protein
MNLADDKYPARDRIRQAIEDGNLESIQKDLTALGVEVGEQGALIGREEVKPASAKCQLPVLRVQCLRGIWGESDLCRR